MEIYHGADEKKLPGSSKSQPAARFGSVFSCNDLGKNELLMGEGVRWMGQEFF